ncbi:hypothetical protein M6G63_10075 [Pseudomonas sp. BYT-5]|uniref:hypothetical protein n=1 Tax=unclassified Pseudomonas TaxID=196821 RepID=UPI0020216B67|nr:MULTISPECIES: hypothetical protein [unclassified Pseudomonas]URD44565.1 hypothetical protein M6G63_10075 [Pseudomonas sp. BYT-5]URK99889.1 hypothetical protein J5X93_10045 [Pseudomonas sp. BYT-1]
MYQSEPGSVAVPESQIIVKAGKFAIDLKEMKEGPRELLVVEERLSRVEKKLGIKPEDAR